MPARKGPILYRRNTTTLYPPRGNATPPSSARNPAARPWPRISPKYEERHISGSLGPLCLADGDAKKAWPMGIRWQEEETPLMMSAATSTANWSCNPSGRASSMAASARWRPPCRSFSTSCSRSCSLSRGSAEVLSLAAGTCSFPVAEGLRYGSDLSDARPCCSRFSLVPTLGWLMAGGSLIPAVLWNKNGRGDHLDPQNRRFPVRPTPGDKDKFWSSH